MEKGQESKQKRKTPLTTIAISQEYAQKLDEYLNGTGITRKEFVELSVDYFQRTGFDLRGEAFDLSPLEKVAGRLEQSAKIMEQHNEGTEAVRQLLLAVREQTAKQLPAPELIAHAAEEKAKAEAKNEEQEREITRLRSENSALLEYWSKNRKKIILNKIGKELIYTLLPFTYCMKKKVSYFFSPKFLFVLVMLNNA